MCGIGIWTDSNMPWLNPVSVSAHGTGSGLLPHWLLMIMSSGARLTRVFILATSLGRTMRMAMSKKKKQTTKATA